MKKIITLLFVLSVIISNGQSTGMWVWKQDTDMRINGRNSSAHRVWVDTTKIDTAFIPMDSALLGINGNIVGFKNGKQVTLFKEKPKPVDTSSKSLVRIIDTAGIDIYTFISDTTYIKEYITRYKTKRTTYTKKVPAKKEKPKPKQYFVGSGEIEWQYGNVIWLINTKGRITSKKPKS